MTDDINDEHIIYGSRGGYLTWRTSCLGTFGTHIILVEVASNYSVAIILYDCCVAQAGHIAI